MFCPERLSGNSMSRPSSAWLVATAVSCHRPDGSPLLADIHFALDSERVGLVGPNGSGKSTLLAVLSGAREPNAGQVTRRGRVAVLSQLATPLPTAAVGTAFTDDTVAQRLGKADVLAALARCAAGQGSAEDIQCIGAEWDLVERLEALLSTFHLGHIRLDRHWSSLSGGEATRMRLAALLLDAPDVLMLDEPTNDLDALHREGVYTLVRTWPRALVVATHDRQLLDHVDRIEAVEQGRLRRYGGNYAHYRAERALQREAAEREFRSAQAAREKVRRAQQAAKERQDRRDAAGRRARARGGQAKILLGMQAERSEGTGARLHGIRQRENDEASTRVREAQAQLEEAVPLAFPVVSSELAAGTLVFAMHDATLSVGEPAEVLAAGLTFELRGPERVAVLGPNGSGKSTLLRVLAGERVPLHVARLHRGVPAEEVVYLDQQVAVLSRHGSVLQAMQHMATSRCGAGMVPDEAALRGALARFGFRRDMAFRSASALSGGERMRAALACVLGVPGVPAPRLLLLDEPTNHLDLDSLEALESVLRPYDGALVVASHDERFLERIAVQRRVQLAGRRGLTEAE
jgi:ATPase subunit of ABC transporter with duplicated ATPase domains